MQLTLETIVAQDPDLVMVEVDGHVMLMAIELGKYFAFNGLGTRIWKLLEKPACLTEVCNTLVASYEVSAEQCQREVLDFVRKLLECQLVRVGDDTQKR